MALKNSTHIPESVRACLWYIDTEAFDLERDKHNVVTQVLNRGTWNAVQWLFQRYGEKTIRDVVAAPRHGLWFPHALTFWLLFFGLTLDRKKYERSLFNISPTPRPSAATSMK